jgi:hypothetical protein
LKGISDAKRYFSRIQYKAKRDVSGGAQVAACTAVVGNDKYISAIDVFRFEKKASPSN